MAGGGLISSIAKHSKLDEANRLINHVQNKIQEAQYRVKHAIETVDALIKGLESQLHEAKCKYDALESERLKLIENFN